MSEKACTYPGREEALVAFIYGEMTPAEHLAFAAHIEDCARCQIEVSGFGAVRKQLSTWAPPEPRRTITGAPVARPMPAPAGETRWAALRDLPGWAQTVAALLVIGVAAGAANLQINYGADGLSIRTGWLGRETLMPAPQPPTAVPEQTPLATRAELAALEQALRQSIPTAKDLRTSVIGETRALLAESERRQENELALRVGTLAQEFQVQRAADNARLNQWVGQFRTTADYQTRAMRDLAVKVSQR